LICKPFLTTAGRKPVDTEAMEKGMMPKTKEPIPYWSALILWTMATCVIANVLALVFQFGGFTTWKSLSKPPSGASHIVDADGLNIWLEANDGNLYTLTLYCRGDQDCEQWIMIDDPTEINSLQCYPIKRSDDCKSLDGYFSPNNPPSSKVNECVVANSCSMDPEYGSETWFALISDGSVKYWEHGNGLLGFSFLFMITTIALPIVTAIIFTTIYQYKKRDNSSG
jgi:hypothetical protein